jgi:hypothetical protein
MDRVDVAEGSEDRNQVIAVYETRQTPHEKFAQWRMMN